MQKENKMDRCRGRMSDRIKDREGVRETQSPNLVLEILCFVLKQAAGGIHQ